MTNYGKTVSAFVYKGKGRDFFFTEDGNDPRKNFTSDWWRRLVQYLNSTL